MISGVSGNNSIYNNQSTINQFRLTQALNKNDSSQSSGTAETPRKRAANALDSSISYIKSYNTSMTDLMDSANSLRTVNSDSIESELSVTSKVNSAMEEFVSSYNQAHSLLQDNVDRGSGTSRQLNRLESVLGPEQHQEMLGLSVNKDGSLTLDKEKLETSLNDEPDLTTDLISGSNGLAQRAFSSSVSSLSTPVGSLIGNDLAEYEYENAMSPTNYMSAFSRTGAHNLSNYYTLGLLLNMTV